MYLEFDTLEYRSLHQSPFPKPSLHHSWPLTSDSANLSAPPPDVLPSVRPALQLRDAQRRRAGERHRGAGQEQDGTATQQGHTT